jgi:pimeloyl-ACP methyl ester carboxylesterase
MRPVILSALLPIVAGCTSASTPDTPREARFEITACPVPPPAGQNEANMKCGDLVVPQDRANPNGLQLRIAVVVLKATGPNPAPDPLVFLSGGPGGISLEGGFKKYGAEFAAPIQKRRDIVFFDPRGVGLTRPSLDCPEYNDFFIQSLAKTPSVEEETNGSVAAMTTCRARWLQQGVDLNHYASADTARDVADLMRLLGHSQFNLYGISYGTRVAATMLRDLPAGVRSVVMDSAVPLEVKGAAAFAANFGRATNAMFAECTSSMTCTQEHPDYKTRYFKLIDDLEKAPLPFSFNDGGSKHQAQLTGWRFLAGTHQAMYDTSLIPLLGTVFEQLVKGETGLLAVVGAQIAAGQRALADGIFHGTRCIEDSHFVTDQDIADATKGVDGRLIKLQERLATTDKAMCKLLALTPRGPEEDKPVKTSSVPALVLAGTLDPITPPSWSKTMASNLSGIYLEFRGFGHGALRADSKETARPRCAMKLVAAFLEDPKAKLDTSCVDAIPAPL